MFIPQRLSPSVLIFSLVFLVACESYDFTINDKLIYSPAPLFSDFEVTDPALQRCLEQGVVDGNVKSAVELVALNCSHAGVTDLAGLEVFTGIAKLKLSSNNIQSLSPLTALAQLELLQLDSNQIVDSSPLLSLTALRSLDLSANTELLCPSDARILALENLDLPEHCQ